MLEGDQDYPSCFLSVKSVIETLYVDGKNFVILRCAIKLINCKVSRTFYITVDTAPCYVQVHFPREATQKHIKITFSYYLYYSKKNSATISTVTSYPSFSHLQSHSCLPLNNLITWNQYPETYNGHLFVFGLSDLLSYFIRPGQ